MIHLFINASAASAGGGLTYVRNVIPHLSSQAGLRTTILASRRFFSDLEKSPRVTLLDAEDFAGGTLDRFWHEQSRLPGLIRRCGCDVLISTGNIALFRSPVPQILLARNALYTSADFYADAWHRRAMNLWLNTRLRGMLTKWSILHSDWVVTPSEAFAREIRTWLGNRPLRISALPHGFDRDGFFSDTRPLPESLQQRMSRGDSCLRLLFVSHYNYFRNFDTLVRALPELKKRLGKRAPKLVLTCRLRPEAKWGSYDAAQIESLVRALKVAEDIVELDLVPYTSLHHVYRACDLYVTASYAESFAHPLVEAMACGLPVVASDLPVHREVCGNAACYFPRFSADALIDRIAGLACSPEAAHDMADRGRARVNDFSWKKHVSQLISLASRLLSGATAPRSSALGETIETIQLSG